VSSSIREQIILAVIALLEAVGGPADLTVHRERTRPIESDELPAILIYCEDDAPETLGKMQYAAPLVTRNLILHVECRALGSTTTPPDAALDPLLVWVTQQLTQNEKFPTSTVPPVNLGNGVEEGKTTWLSKEGDQMYAAASTEWTVKYRTSRLDPTLRT
jgi:hypothetical protein